MAPSPKPSILIIPGSFTTAAMYYPVLTHIGQLDPSLHAYVNNLPSAIRNSPEEPASLQDDADFFRGIVEKVADRGEEIVLVAHSYGGVVGTEVVKGVSRAERKENGLKGGVVRIVYLSAHVPTEGQSLKDEVGDPPEQMATIGKDGFIYIANLETIARGAFPDLDFEKAVDVVKSMGRHSNLSFNGKVTYPGYKHIPVS